MVSETWVKYNISLTVVLGGDLLRLEERLDGTSKEAINVSLNSLGGQGLGGQGVLEQCALG